LNFSPDGKIIASGSTDKTIKLWDTSGKMLKTFKEHGGEVMDVNFSSDGEKILSAAIDGLRIWDLLGNQLVQFGGTTQVTGEYAGAGFNIEQNYETMGLTVAKVFKNSPAMEAGIKEGDQILAINGKSIIQPAGNWMIISDAINLIKGEEGTTLTLQISRQGSEPFDLPITRKKIKHSAIEPIPYLSAKFSPNDQIIVSGGQIVKLWNIDGKELKNLEGHTGMIRTVNFSPDGQFIASASDDNTIKLWRCDGTEVKTLKGHKDSVWNVSFSPDGLTIASASWDGTVKLWNIEGKEIKTLDKSSYFRNLTKSTLELSLYSINFSPDGKIIASAAEDGTVKLWNTNGSFIKSLPDKDHHISSFNRYFDMSFSPDGETIAVTEVDNTVKLYKIEDDTLLGTLIGHDAPVNSVKFSPDGHLIATASNDNTIKLWNSNGTVRETFRGHNNIVWNANFSPDGEIIVSASKDGMIKLWSLDGREIKSLQANDLILDVDFSPDGKSLIAACKDGTVLLWNFDLNILVEHGCDWIDNYLKNNSNIKKNDKHLCEGVDFSTLTLIEQGRNFATFGAVEEAIIKFQQAIKKDPTLKFNPEIQARNIAEAAKLVLEGNKLARENNIKDAVEKFERALQLDMNLNFNPMKKAQYLAAVFLVTEGERLAKAGNIQGAVAKFNQALEWNSDINFDPDEKARNIVTKVLVKKAEESEKQEEIEKAILLYEEAKNLNSNEFERAGILYALGLLYSRIKQLDLAKDCFMEILKSGWYSNVYITWPNAKIKSIDSVIYQLGSIAQLEGELKTALSWYKKVNKGLYRLDAQMQTAFILAEQGDLEKALEHVHHVAIDNEKDKLALAKFEADLLAWQKRHDEAMGIYNRLIEENPDNTDLLFSRATLADTMGNFEQYEKDLRRVLEINPKHVNALNFLGYTLAERTARYQEAYDLLKQANELEPENPFVLDSFGWVLYKMGKHSESVEYLRKAYADINASEFPDAAAETAAHLGEVLWISGNTDEAKAVFEKALQVFPENEKLKETIRRFMP